MYFTKTIVKGEKKKNFHNIIMGFKNFETMTSN